MNAVFSDGHLLWTEQMYFMILYKMMTLNIE